MGINTTASKKNPDTNALLCTLYTFFFPKAKIIILKS